MKKALILNTVLFGSLALGSVAVAADLWRTVSVTVSGVASWSVCDKAESNLRSQYSDVTTVNISHNYDQYTNTLYCTATGQTQL